ncbi:MAG TPA: VWA domain-containing protein [Nannocystaceae bacterium]|nr:VWA domain-containing protein [Nannocystaceae bacterium]
MRFLRTAAIGAAALPLVACFHDATLQTDSDGATTAASAATSTSSTSAGASSTDTAGLTSAATATTDTGEAPPSDAVDILLVIDNSGSMAEEQARLTDAIGALVDPLVAAGLDLRLAIASTDRGNPVCTLPNSAPKSGDFILGSCLARVDAGDFLFPSTPPIDAVATCADRCALDASALAITPTVTDLDPEPSARPWIEWGPGGKNLPEGTALIDALRCFVPQGITGCGIEGPLENTLSALTKAGTPGSANYGFLRADARLVVLIVSDETDCSYDPAHESVFVDNKVFWNSPDDTAPTSAACWRAGVACIGDGPDYEGCAPVDLDEMGAPAAAPGDAVLFPLSRYTEFLKLLALDKAALGPDAVLPFLIAGVPPGYAGPADLAFGDGDDPAFLADFGIGPACVAAMGDAAVPSVRERVVVEGLADPTHVTSICEPDYGPALAVIAARVLGE